MKYALNLNYTLLKKQTPEKENDVLEKRKAYFTFDSLDAYDDFIRFLGLHFKRGENKGV